MATAAAVRHRDIDDATLAVLASMRVDGQVVLPYAEKLDRDAYLRLNKVLEALGGKWKRGKGHVFDGDPSERIEAAVATGSYACPKLSGFDFFPTARRDRGPAPLCREDPGWHEGARTVCR